MTLTVASLPSSLSPPHHPRLFLPTSAFVSSWGKRIDSPLFVLSPTHIRLSRRGAREFARLMEAILSNSYTSSLPPSSPPPPFPLPPSLPPPPPNIYSDSVYHLQMLAKSGKEALKLVVSGAASQAHKTLTWLCAITSQDHSLLVMPGCQRFQTHTNEKRRARARRLMSRVLKFDF